jgi:putative acetyltransferase
MALRVRSRVQFMTIKLDDLSGPEIQELLRHHIAHLSSISDPCSMHALNLDALRKPNISFWSAWSDDHPPQLMGCGALKELDSTHAEVKSMRTATAHLRRGVAANLLTHIISEARRRNYHRLSLETGAGPLFTAAQTLYRKVGFQPCAPFADYRPDPNSLFFTLEIKT